MSETLVVVWVRHQNGAYTKNSKYGEDYARRIVAEANAILEKRCCAWRYEVFPDGVNPNEPKGA